MTGSERSMRRMGRMAGIELASEDVVERLWSLHRELRNAGLPEWAEKIAQVLKIRALTAAAEYTRRNSAYFVRSGSGVLTPEETTQRREAIGRLADAIDDLVQTVMDGQDDYLAFEGILSQLRGLGFWIDNALVSAVARAFTLP